MAHPDHPEQPLESNDTAPAADTASWWDRSLSRRDAHKVGLSVAALASMTGCDSSKVVEMDSISAQKEGGWDVGDTGAGMSIANPATTDSTGSSDWKPYATVPKLLAATTPKDETHKRWQMPTLIQALEQPTLAAKMVPVSSAMSKDTRNRARSLGTLISAMENAKENLIVVDVPGANAPAAAAGLAPWVEPVFFFDNWPHPKGVVRSQAALGSLIYYGRELEKAAGKRDNAKAPPAIILDQNRTATYTLPDKQFDNRYLAALPEPEDLQKAGIKRVIYVTMTETQEESDDLNDLFVAYEKAGLKSMNVALADFKKDPEHVAKDGEDPTGGYYYGGHHRHHTHFFMWYPFFIWGGPRYGWSSPRTSAAPTRAKPSSYKPKPRQTMYSGRKTGGVKGVGRSKPVGFGKVSTRQGSGGKIMGTRSGSVGRFRSSSSFGG